MHEKVIASDVDIEPPNNEHGLEAYKLLSLLKILYCHELPRSLEEVHSIGIIHYTEMELDPALALIQHSAHWVQLIVTRGRVPCAWRVLPGFQSFHLPVVKLEVIDLSIFFNP